MINIVLRNKANKDYALAEIAKLELDPDIPLDLIVREHQSTRSTEANALYWKWLTEMGKFFIGKDEKKDKYLMHDLMRHNFLGYDENQVGRTKIRTLKSTQTGVKNMYKYMFKVDIWATDKGCYLPRPEHSDYDKYREAAL